MRAEERVLSPSKRMISCPHLIRGEPMHTPTETVPPAEQLTPPAEPSQRVILHGVSWATYPRLLDDFKDSHAAHFAYDRGVLEIMVLSTKHERPNRTLALLVEVLAEELNTD